MCILELIWLHATLQGSCCFQACGWVLLLIPDGPDQPDAGYPAGVDQGLPLHRWAQCCWGGPRASAGHCCRLRPCAVCAASRASSPWVFDHHPANSLSDLNQVAVAGMKSMGFISPMHSMRFIFAILPWLGAAQGREAPMGQDDHIGVNCAIG